MADANDDLIDLDAETFVRSRDPEKYRRLFTRLTDFKTIKFKSQPGDILKEAKSHNLSEGEWLDLIVRAFDNPDLHIQVECVSPKRHFSMHSVVRWIEVRTGFFCRLETMIAEVEKAIPPAIWLYGIERRDSSQKWGYSLSFEINTEIINGGARL